LALLSVFHKKRRENSLLLPYFCIKTFDQVILEYLQKVQIQYGVPNLVTRHFLVSAAVSKIQISAKFQRSKKISKRILTQEVLAYIPTYFTQKNTYKLFTLNLKPGEIR
jgi:hypothetical protein